MVGDRLTPAWRCAGRRSHGCARLLRATRTAGVCAQGIDERASLAGPLLGSPCSDSHGRSASRSGGGRDRGRSVAGIVFVLVIRRAKVVGVGPTCTAQVHHRYVAHPQHFAQEHDEHIRDKTRQDKTRHPSAKHTQAHATHSLDQRPSATHTAFHANTRAHARSLQRFKPQSNFAPTTTRHRKHLRRFGGL